MIPEYLIRFCLSESKLSALTILCHCKDLYHAYTDSLSMPMLCARTGLSESTIRRLMQWLQKRNWIGRDGQTWYFRGWKRILRDEGVRHRRYWEIESGTAKEMESEFHAAVLSGLLRWQNGSNGGARRHVCTGHPALKGRLSVRWIAKTLDVPITTAFRMRHSAAIGGDFSKVEHIGGLKKKIYYVPHYERKAIDAAFVWLGEADVFESRMCCRKRKAS